MAKPVKRGRPLQAEAARDVVLKMRFTQAEHAAVMVRGGSTWARELILKTIGENNVHDIRSQINQKS